MFGIVFLRIDFYNIAWKKQADVFQCQSRVTVLNIHKNIIYIFLLEKSNKNKNDDYFVSNAITRGIYLAMQNVI